MSTTGRKRLPRAARREQLLDTAAGIVAREGIDALVMERLAAEAGISKPVLYDHFDSRSAVVLALLERGWAQLDERVARAMEGARSFTGRVRAAIGAYFDVLLELGPLLQASPGGLALDAAVMRRVEDRHRQVVSAWADEIRREQRLPAETAEAAAAMLVGTVDGGARHLARSGENREPLEELAALAVTAFVRALARNARSGRPDRSTPA